MKKMLCPEFMAYNMPRDKNHITHGVWNEVNIWLVLPAVLRPLNKIVPLIQLNGTLVIMANYLYTSKGDGSHDGVAIGDIDLCSHSVRSGLDLTEGVTYTGMLQG